MYRLYQLLIVLPLGLLITGLAAISMGVGCLIGPSRFWSYWPMRIWAASIVRLCLLPVEVVGKEHLTPGQSYIFIANHQGAFDIFLLAGFLHVPFKWMMKKSLRTIPLVGWACEKAGFIFVDKKSRSGIVNTIRNAKAALQGGASMAIFPEGARTWDGRMGEFRKGSFLIAKQIGLPLVPITIDGAFEVLPRQKGFNFVRHHRMRLIIHPAIAPDDRALALSRNIIMNDLPAEHHDASSSPEIS